MASLVGTRGDDTLSGGWPDVEDDTLRGLAGDDELYGYRGDDLIKGGRGRDSLYGVEGRDTLIGGLGADDLWGGSGDNLLIGGDHRDSLSGGAGSDRLFGGKARDFLYGGADSDRLIGGAGDDYMDGQQGADYLRGGAGADLLWGGEGEDWFVFTQIADSPVADRSYDRVVFVPGEDKFVLSGAMLGGADTLAFIGQAAFSATGAGEIRWERSPDQRSFIHILIDTNGDGGADMLIGQAQDLAPTDADFLFDPS